MEIRQHTSHEAIEPQRKQHTSDIEKNGNSEGMSADLPRELAGGYSIFPWFCIGRMCTASAFSLSLRSAFAFLQGIR